VDRAATVAGYRDRPAGAMTETEDGGGYFIGSSVNFPVRCEPA
jgi:hypothetical protein